MPELFLLFFFHDEFKTDPYLVSPDAAAEGVLPVRHGAVDVPKTLTIRFSH